MYTIKDVAKLANVSISTVSYAINNTGNVSEKTRKKVLAAAKELDYKPNGMARSLKMKKNNIIAVVVNEFYGPIYGEIIRGITQITKTNEYEVVVAECFSDKVNITKVLSQRLVDGAIILAANVDNDTIESLASEHFPIVTLDRELRGDYITSVLIDNEVASYEIAKYFYELGYKQVGFLSGPKDTYDNNKRFEGFKKGIKEFDLEFSAKYHINGDFTEQGGYLAMQKFLKENIPPRAFFIANDEMAIGALKALEENNISVPEQVALIGFDDIRLGEYVTPKLTTVKRPCYDLGVVAANSLIAALKGEHTSKVTTLSSELIIRESCHK
ncbi:MAG: LacI family DNA-binding transcriptional regulator [Cellulosilyticaceae bacterium]